VREHLYTFINRRAAISISRQWRRRLTRPTCASREEVAALRKERERERRTFVFDGGDKRACATIYCSSTRRLTNYDITLDEFLGADLPAAHHLSLWCVFACQESLNLLLSLSRDERCVRNDDGEHALSLLRRKACAD
jgi:hypothetical protein